tara:strand:+ start:352 stop:609 length:258 start_codon:yes stop_codon:yes gene_type:complete
MLKKDIKIINQTKEFNLENPILNTIVELVYFSPLTPKKKARKGNPQKNTDRKFFYNKSLRNKVNSSVNQLTDFINGTTEREVLFG